MALLNRIGNRTGRVVEDRAAPDLFAAPRYIEHPRDCFFYHTIDLPQHGIQQGGWDLRGRFLDYIGHVDVSGKRVLDVGSASGFLSFEAERFGAREVVSFDLDGAHRQSLLPFAGSDYVVDYAKWCRRQTQAFGWWQNAYWLTHRLMRSRAKVLYGNVYDLPPALGLFDVVIVGAILEHLVDPLTALFSLSRHARDFIVINTDYLDTPETIAAFNGQADRPTNNFVFWTYSIALYDEYMRIMGFNPHDQRKGAFLGTPHREGEKRPEMNRVALVYRRDAKNNPVLDRIPERVKQ